jgi:hypothetical protein
MARNNKLVVPGSEAMLNQMKMEIAKEFGVELGPDATARANGSVGGEMTKRLIALGQQYLAEQSNEITPHIQKDAIDNHQELH